jgi:acetoin utilization deacetylase AcuC-like enzyme
MKIVHSRRHALHATTLDLPGCPTPYLEVPARVEVIIRALAESGLGQLIEAEDYGMEYILSVHRPDFVQYLQQAYEQSRPFYPGANAAIADTFCGRGWRHRPSGWLGRLGYFMFDATCPILEGTWEAAYWSAQCGLTAADLVHSGEPVVYSLCRPPGHHAASDQHGGFCYLNNAAIAAEALRRWTGERVAILDIDYHHGNGTQEIFYASANVLFCSLHANPDIEYPFFWGGDGENGVGKGIGANRNWPLPHATREGAYLEVLTGALAAIRHFGAGYLVLSAGFDFMPGDPAPLDGGAFRIGETGLASIAVMIAGLALPTVIVQEGGYNVEQLGGHVVRFLTEFANAHRPA